MYFPYLRGKQYELLAIKEMSSVLGPAHQVTPVIEPVRDPKGSGLDRCIAALGTAGLDFVLVVNPGVGALRGPGISQPVQRHVNQIDEAETWGLGLLVDESTDLPDLLAEYAEAFGRSRPLSLMHRGYAEGLSGVGALTESFNRSYDLIDSNLRRARYRPLLANSSPVVLRDAFPAEDRNSDYLAKSESMFTEDHLFYAEEGWYGFSDYVTIGEPYSESGFTPRAVAIHWTYEPQPGSAIMIRHFTSFSNHDSTADVGGKFLEAAAKLVAFLDDQGIHTRASEVMRSHLEERTYPGLGIVKKLSIQNHLELVSGILSRS